MKRIKRFVLAIAVLIVGLFTFSGCKDIGPLVPTFEEQCVTTEDGFVYYVDKNIGLCIIDIPDTEEVTIPEYIDDQKVMQLGYKHVGSIYGDGGTYWVDGKHVKKLILQHKMDYYSANFMNVEVLTHMDPVTSLPLANNGKLIIDGHLRSTQKYGERVFDNLTDVILVSKERETLDDVGFTEVHIFSIVTSIEKGVFDGLEGVTIKTSYESKPEGWEDGWNGACAVEWGASIED